MMDQYANQCQCCGKGPVYVYSTTANEKLGKRIQYLRCAACGDTPGKRVIPLSQSPPRLRYAGIRIRMERR